MGLGISTHPKCGNQETATVSLGVPWLLSACLLQLAHTRLRSHVPSKNRHTRSAGGPYPRESCRRLASASLPPYSAGQQDQLCRYGIEPNPGPSLRVLQWNANSFVPNKRLALGHICETNNIDLVVIQEVKWDPHQVQTIAGYGVTHKLRNSRGGGLAVFARTGILTRKLPHPVPDVDASSLEALVMEVSVEGEVLILLAVYCPPGNDFPLAWFTSVLSHYADRPVLICGDFNAHTELWDPHCQPSPRGASVQQLMEEQSLSLLNDPLQHTRCRGSRVSTPDLTLARSLTCISWTTIQTTLSDHHHLFAHIMYGLNSQRPKQRPTRAHYCWAKANWSLFGSLVSTKLPSIGKSTSSTAASFRTALLNAALAAIPKGTYDAPQALWSAEADQAEQASLAARRAASEGNDPALWTEYYLTNDRYRTILHELSRTEFRKRCTKLTPQTRSSWRMIKTLRTAPTAATPLLDGGRVLRSAISQATAFIRAYSHVSRRPFPPPTSTPLAQQAEHCHPVTTAEIQAALKSLNAGKAAGLDGIHAEMLQHLPSDAIAFVQSMIDISLRTGEVPLTWRQSVIVALPKPGKDTTLLDSYRPVSLTSIVSKLAELVVLRRIKRYLDPTLSDTQSGFRQGRSTSDQVAKLLDYVNQSFNKRSHSASIKCVGSHKTTAVFIDLSKAFDTVDHSKLMYALKERALPKHYVRWIRNFLSGRESRCRVGTQVSSLYPFTAGVPQGSILGPYLFCVYVDTLSKRLQNLRNTDAICARLEHGFFADDLTIYCEDRHAADTAVPLQRALDVVAHWCNEFHMKPNVAKTEYVVFRRGTHIPSGGEDVPLLLQGQLIHRSAHREVKDVRLLGVRLDSQLTMAQHADYLRVTLTKRVQQLAIVAGSDWGPSTADLRSFMLGYIAPVLNYASEAWYAFTSEFTRNKLEVLATAASRAASGLLTATPVQDVHMECDTLPLRDVATLSSLAYYERGLRTSGDRQRIASTAPQFAAGKAFTKHPRSDADQLGVPPSNEQTKHWPPEKAFTII